MGSPLNVRAADMAKGQTDVLNATVDVKKTLAVLQGDVDELLVGWRSAGADGFSSAHQAWTEKATTITNALENLGEKLGIVGTTTSHGDHAVVDTFTPFTR